MWRRDLQRANAFYLTLHECNYNSFMNVFSYTIFKSAAVLKYYQTNIKCFWRKSSSFRKMDFLSGDCEYVWSNTWKFFSKAEVKDSGLPKRRQLIDMDENNRSTLGCFVKLLTFSSVRHLTGTSTSINWSSCFLCNAKSTANTGLLSDSTFYVMRNSYGRNFKFQLLRKGLNIIKYAENFSLNGSLN